VSVEETKLVLKASSNEETKKIYPFDFTLTATYELIENRILFSVNIKNESDELLPHMFGWHPGFLLPTDDGQKIEDYIISFEGGLGKISWTPLQHGCFARPYAEDYITPNGAYRLCEEEIYKNDTMIFSDCGNSIKLFAEGKPFEIYMKWTENLPYICVWKEPVSEANFICLEPWSGTPNDGETEENFETRKMERLAPKSEAVYAYELSFNF
jgi:galactose mutarotase-like enzyme